MAPLRVSTRVAVVGGGAAGMAAALSAAAAGAEVLLVDDQPAGSAGMRALPPSITLWNGSVAWGLTPERELAVFRGGRTHFVAAHAIVLACGVEDQTFPFPGGSLAGVAPAGELFGAQLPVDRVAGRRVVLAGAGPDLFAAAVLVIEHGGVIAAVLDACGIPRTGAPLCARTRAAMRKLAAGGVVPLAAHRLLRAEGDRWVRRAVAAGLPASAGPGVAAETVFEADRVITCFGVRPVIGLARLANCRHDYDDGRGSWITRHDEQMETTVRGVFVAGQGARSHNAPIATWEGRLAGLAAALRSAGRSPQETSRHMASLRRGRARRATIEATIDSRRWQDGWLDVVTPDTVVCPCEGVRAGEIDAVARFPGVTVRDLKNQTRVATGECQGRLCLSAASALLARRRGIPASALDPPSVRPPVRPLPLAALLRAD